MSASKAGEFFGVQPALDLIHFVLLLQDQEGSEGNLDRVARIGKLASREAVQRHFGNRVRKFQLHTIPHCP